MAAARRAAAVPAEVGHSRATRSSATAFSIEVGGNVDADGHAAVGRHGHGRAHRAAAASALRAASGSSSRSARSRSSAGVTARRASAGAGGASAGSSPTRRPPTASSSTRVLQHASTSSDFPADVALGRGRARSSRAARRLGRRARATKDRGELFGARRAPGAAHRRAARRRDGMFTLYGRAALDGAELSLPSLPSIGHGREEWIVEYTFGRDGRRASSRSGTASRANGGNRSPRPSRGSTCATRRISRSPGRCSTSTWPLAAERGARGACAGGRIATTASSRRTVSDVDDDPAGLSGSVSGRRGSSAPRQAHQRSTASSSRRPRDRRAVRARALRLDCQAWRWSRDVPGPELDEVAVGVVDVGRAGVRAGAELVLADVEARWRAGRTAPS